MRLVIQRVQNASVEVEGDITGQISKGYLVFVGVSNSDDRTVCDKLLDKMLKLRIFEDEEGKTNRSITDVGGAVLLVSQFTLYANCRKGNRPSFTEAGDPDTANELYEYMIERCKATGIETASGIFGADMKVSLVNDGPFTVILDSEELNGPRRG